MRTTKVLLEPIECPSCAGERIRPGPVVCKACRGEGRVAPPSFAAASDSLDDIAELDRELAALDERAEAAC